MHSSSINFSGATLDPVRGPSQVWACKQQGYIEQGHNVQQARLKRDSVFPGIFVDVEVDQSHVAFRWLPR